MYIAAINMEKKYNKENNTTEYKPLLKIKINKCAYKIIVSRKEKNTEDSNNICELMLNAKLMDWIKIRHDDKEYEIHDVPFHGIKINFDCLNKPLVITAKPKDYCSKINIWENKNLGNKELYDIKWDKIYIINLKRRPERMKKMIEQMEKFEITDYEFIEAVDGSDEETQKEFEKEKENNKYKTENNRFIVTNGHYGCLKSHMKAISKAKEEKLENVMILEDDAILDEDFIEKMQNKKVPKYDLLYLGGISRSLKIYFDDWASSKHIMGAYAYILNQRMYNKILVDLTKNPLYIDTYYLQNIQEKDIYKAYILSDYIKTTIETSDTSHKNAIITKPLEYINNPGKYYKKY